MPGGSTRRFRFDQIVAHIAYVISGNEVKPDRDINNDGWGPEPIFEVIDDDDNNCVLSPVNPVNRSFEVGIGELVDFDKNKPVVIRYSFSKVDTGGSPAAGGNILDLTVEIKEGTTSIETFTYTDVKAYEATQVVRLSGVGKNKITDPTRLSVKVTANTSTSGIADRRIQFCFLRLGTNQDPVSRAIQNIDGSGQARNGVLYINLQGVRGTVNRDWQKDVGKQRVVPDTNVDAVIAKRLARSKYYSGDLS